MSDPTLSPWCEGTLPPVEFRERVAATVHQAVVDVTGTTGKGWCALYALAGTMVLNKLMPSLTYVYQAGSLFVQVTQDGQYIAFDAEQGGVPTLEYHAWITRLHQMGPSPRRRSSQPFQLLGTGERLEVIDFAARFYRQQAVENGHPWEMSEPPAYLWCWHDELNGKGVVLKPDTQATQQLLALTPGLAVGNFSLLCQQTARRAFDLYEGRAQSGSLSRQQRRALQRQRQPAGKRGGAL